MNIRLANNVRLILAVGIASSIVRSDGGETTAPAGLAQVGRFSTTAASTSKPLSVELSAGGIIRGPTDARRLALIFTGHMFGEGGEAILGELASHKAKASFFLTGDFLVNSNFTALVRRIVADGHYLGPHSDKHLLFCSWEQERRTLITHDAFVADLNNNLAKIAAYGVPRAEARYFLPAFEHYNQQVATWTKELGLTLINFTPGTRSNADYTEEADPHFVSSQAIFDSIRAREQRDAHGFNGFLLLFHIGSGPGRSDKLHLRAAELLDWLGAKGYQCVRVDELLEGNQHAPAQGPR